jgi:hypothetical protein
MRMLLLSLFLLTACATPPAAHEPYRLTGDGAALRPFLDRGIAIVQDWFGAPFPASFTVAVFPDRAAFTASFPQEWGMTETQCWMVASGVADMLRVLAPSDWRREACEHDPDDATHLGQLLAHELTHVFHGQHNPTRDFTGADEIGWFVEGLAVLVSGQLEQGHRARTVAAVAAGEVPTALAKAWSGPNRYGVSGTMVQYFERLVGRRRLFELLAATDDATLLAATGMTETEFLYSWADFVRRGDAQ